MPPTVHQTFQGPNFVICSFCPRMLDWARAAIPIPYNHSNLQTEEMIYYVERQLRLTPGVDVGVDHAAPVGTAARAGAGRGRALDRSAVHRRAGGDVRHVPPAAADRARRRRSTTRRYALRGPPTEPGACLRRVSCTRRSRPPMTARSPSISTRTTPGVGDPEYRAAAQPDRVRGAGLDGRPGRLADAADRLHRGRAGRCGAPSARELAAKHERLACRDYRDGDGSPRASGRPHPPARRGRRPAATRSPGFRVPPGRRTGAASRTFYGSLADGVFHSTQYVRHHAPPALHARARPDPRGRSGTAGCWPAHGWPSSTGSPGEASRRLETPAGRATSSPSVFWFSIEFGVLYEHGRAARLRRRPALLLRRDRRVPQRGDPSARHRGDGDPRVRHHPLPADPVRGRRDRATARGGRRVLRALRRRHARPPRRRALAASPLAAPATAPSGNVGRATLPCCVDPDAGNPRLDPSRARPAHRRTDGPSGRDRDADADAPRRRMTAHTPAAGAGPVERAVLAPRRAPRPGRCWYRAPASRRRRAPERDADRRG